MQKDNFSKYPYPTPDWLNANQSFSAPALEQYYVNRTGRSQPNTLPLKANYDQAPTHFLIIRGRLLLSCLCRL